MRYVVRALTPELHRAARAFGAIIVTGPRRSGKTTLLRHAFPQASYHLLQNPDAVARFRADPQGFLDGIRVPEILAFIRARIDRRPADKRQWLQESRRSRPGDSSQRSNPRAPRADVVEGHHDQLLPAELRPARLAPALRSCERGLVHDLGHFPGGDFQLRRDDVLVARRDARRAAFHQLGGAKRGDDDKLERIRSIGPGNHVNLLAGDDRAKTALMRLVAPGVGAEA